MRLIDTHTHLDFPDFDADRDAVLARAGAAGVERLVVLGVYQENWQRLWQMALQHDALYAAFGLHPVYLAQHRPEHLLELHDWLQRLAGHAKLCAVGEFGLDYYIDDPDPARQQALFEAQLRLAVTFELPVLLHVRRAHAATIATLKRIRVPRGGVIHAFSGSYEEAREYMKLGFKLGLGGAATWPQATRMHKVLAKLPLDSVVLETDAPDMAPAMHPQQRNSPEYLADICTSLAERLHTDADTVANASTRNAAELFGWRL